MKMLIELGLDLETLDPFGESALLLAIQCQSNAIVQRLIEKGASIESPLWVGDKRATLAIWAASRGNRALKRLVEQMNLKFICH